MSILIRIEEADKKYLDTKIHGKTRVEKLSNLIAEHKQIVKKLDKIISMLGNADNKKTKPKTLDTVNKKPKTKPKSVNKKEEVKILDTVNAKETKPSETFVDFNDKWVKPSSRS